MRGSACSWSLFSACPSLHTQPAGLARLAESCRAQTAGAPRRALRPPARHPWTFHRLRLPAQTAGAGAERRPHSRGLHIIKTATPKRAAAIIPSILFHLTTILTSLPFTTITFTICLPPTHSFTFGISRAVFSSSASVTSAPALKRSRTLPLI